MVLQYTTSQRVLGARLGVSEMQNCTGHMFLLVREKFVAAMSWCVLFRCVQYMYRGTSLISSYERGKRAGGGFLRARYPWRAVIAVFRPGPRNASGCLES